MRSVPRIPRHLIYATTLRIGVISLTLLTGVAVGMPEHPAAAAPLHQGAWITPAAKENSNIVETRFRGGGMPPLCAVVAPSFAGAALGYIEAERLYVGAVPSRGVARGATGGRQAEQSPQVPLSES
jgi:hypothetical protein